MSRSDYRVKVRVEFFIELAAEEPVAAEETAERITRHVFKEDYSRADDVHVEAIETWPMVEK